MVRALAGGTTVMGQKLTPLDTRDLGGRRAEILSDFVYESDELGTITVPAGFVTDFHSIPRGLWNILPPWDHKPAAVVHDFLYKEGEANGEPVNRGQADRTYNQILEDEGAPTWRRRLQYRGVRLGGWRSWGKYRKADATTVSSSADTMPPSGREYTSDDAALPL